MKRVGCLDIVPAYHPHDKYNTVQGPKGLPRRPSHHLGWPPAQPPATAWLPAVLVVLVALVVLVVPTVPTVPLVLFLVSPSPL